MTIIAGKNILLTGGSRGIGPIIGEALAKKGGHIALTARSEKLLTSVKKNINKYDNKSRIFLADLSKPNECEKLITEVNNKFGNIDILINNAGVETEGSFFSLSWEAIHETIEINLSSPMYLTRLVLSKMITNKSGHIVNISSIGGKCGAPYAATYSATKAGLAEWSQALRLELDGTGVKVSTIFPGYITGVGMFAKFGVTAPKMVGSCTPAQVSEAVVRAIEKNSIDVIINSMPLRIMFATRELFPSIGDWLLNKLGVIDFQRRKVGL